MKKVNMEEYEEIVELARTGHLPGNFDNWALASKIGLTVAHEAAQFGHLPPDFKDWALDNGRGKTVAHTAAQSRHGLLPPDFTAWELKDNRGITVAEWAYDRRKITRKQYSEIKLLLKIREQQLGSVENHTENNKGVEIER